MGALRLPIGERTLVAVLRAENVRMKGHPDWETWERDDETGKKFGAVCGVMIHHTAGRDGTAALDLVRNGRTDLPGPLAHAYGAKDGTVYILSNGRANHAGMIARNVYLAVVNEYPSHPVPGPDEIDGNDRFYGIEIANMGDGKDPYPVEQYDAAVRWATALCRFHGWTADSVIGHKEATRRKIDPSFSMDRFRWHVRTALALPRGAWQGSTSPTIERDDMDAQDVWAYVGINATDDRNAIAYLIGAYERIKDLQTELAKISSVVVDLKAAVNELRQGDGS